MAITNPLELPEIREALAPFLATDDLAQCIRVCRAWHTSFLPFFWKVVDIFMEQDKNPSLELLKGHSNYVAQLIYQGDVPADHLSMQFPALRRLHFLKAAHHHTGMIAKHSSLTHLKLHGSSSYRIIVWSPPASLSNLTSLSLRSMDLRTQNNDMVWGLVSRLESFEMRRSMMPELPKSTTSSWRMKDLILDSTSDHDAIVQMTWMERCPHLKQLTWIPLYSSTREAVERLIQHVSANIWPELEEFSSPYLKGTDQQLSLVVNVMRRVPCLSIECNEPLDFVKTALRPHFPWLRKLEVATTSDNTLFTIEVLKSCPKLETLQMGVVHVRGILDDDAPWVCESSLRHLAVCFNIESGNRKTGQRMVLERLSRFRNLERLDLSCKTPLEESLDLRLESGLEQLATLTRLEELNFKGTVQRMKIDEVEWMIKHWKKLKRVLGRLNSEDAVEWGQLVTRLYTVGIANNPWNA